MTKTISTMSSAMTTIRNSVSSSFSSLKNSAYNWGADLTANLAAGIRSRQSSAVAAASAVASAVRSILHFSVPDKGPLSDADEYGGDFVQLIADKMVKNKGVAAKAASSVAGAISDKIKSGDYTVSRISVSKLENIGNAFVEKFDRVTDRLQAIVDSANFRLPTVATAGVVPYSVAAQTATMGGTARGDDEKLDRLIALMERFVSGGTPPQVVDVRVRAEADPQGIFKTVTAMGHAARRTTGRNPFMLGGDR